MKAFWTLLVVAALVASALAEKPLVVDDPAADKFKPPTYRLPRHDDLIQKGNRRHYNKYREELPTEESSDGPILAPSMRPLELNEEAGGESGAVHQADPEKEREEANKIIKQARSANPGAFRGGMVYPDGLGDSNQHPPLDRFDGALLKNRVPAEQPRVMYQKPPMPIPRPKWEPLNGRGAPEPEDAAGAMASMSPQLAAIAEAQEEESEREQNAVRNMVAHEAEKNQAQPQQRLAFAQNAKYAAWRAMPTAARAGQLPRVNQAGLPIIGAPMMQEMAQPQVSPQEIEKYVDPKLRKGLDQSLTETNQLFNTIQGDSHAEVSIGSQIEQFLNKEKSLGQTVAAQIGDNARKLAAIKQEEEANLKEAKEDQGAYKADMQHLSWEESKLRGIQQQEKTLQHEYTTDEMQEKQYESKEKGVEQNYQHVVQVQSALEAERKNFVAATQRLIGQYDQLQQRYDAVQKSYIQGFGAEEVPSKIQAAGATPAPGAAPAKKQSGAPAPAPSMMERVAPAPRQPGVQPLHESPDEIYG